MNSPSMEKKKTTFMTDTGMIKQKSEIKKESSLEKTIKPAYEDEEEEDVKDNHNDVNGAKVITKFKYSLKHYMTKSYSSRLIQDIIKSSLLLLEQISSKKCFLMIEQKN